jgi:hypothetical protein
MQLRNDRLEPLCQQAGILGTPVRAIVCPSAGRRDCRILEDGIAVQTAVNPTSVAAAFSDNSTHAAPDQETAGVTPTRSLRPPATPRRDARIQLEPGQSGNPTGQTAIGGPLRSGNGAKVEPVRHRQTKGTATDMFGLQPLRHTPTLPPLGAQLRRADMI